MSGVHNRAKGVEWMLLEQRCQKRANSGAGYRDANFPCEIIHPPSRRVMLLAHNPVHPRRGLPPPSALPVPYRNKKEGKVVDGDVSRELPSVSTVLGVSLNWKSTYLKEAGSEPIPEEFLNYLYEFYIGIGLPMYSISNRMHARLIP